MNTPKPESLKSPTYFYSLILAACLGSISIGYQFGIFNTCSSAIASYYNYADDENKQLYEGLINSSLTFGGIIGSFYASSLLKTGRRSGLILIDIMTIISISFCFFGGIFSLILSRLLCGVSLGLNSVIIPIFITEFSPNDISGTTGSLHAVFISTGVLVSFFFGFVTPYNENFDNLGITLWKLLFSMPIFIALLRLYLMMRFFHYETPNFLYKKKKEAEAKIVIRELYTDTYEVELMKSLSKADYTSLQYTDLFSPKYYNQMKFGLLLSAIQQFSGINALIFYSNQIFLEDGNETTAIIFTFLVGILLTFTALISGKFMDVFGRRKAMLYGDSLSVLSLGLIVLLKPTEYSFLIKYLILVFIFTFGVSLGPILWVYLSETLPEKGVSLATLINYASCLVIALVFPKLIASPLKFVGTFMIFFLISLAGLIYIYFNMMETKGKTPSEIIKISQYDSVNIVFVIQILFDDILCLF